MSEPEKTPDPESHMEERDGVTVVGAQIIGPVKVDTTVRPRDPNVPIFWPEDVPMPWKTNQQPPPEPPETE
jgi:hypothetical protein